MCASLSSGRVDRAPGAYRDIVSLGSLVGIRRRISPGARWRPVVLGAVAATVLGAGCRDAFRDASPPGNEGAAGVGGDVEPSSGEIALGTEYLRTLVFLEMATDTSMVVAWDFGTGIQGDSIRRSIRGWLGRGGQWSLFVDDAWTTGPLGSPWTILPRGAVRLIVGQADQLREVRYQESDRRLALRLGDEIADWTDGAGNSYRVHAGAARLGEAEMEGWLLDVSSAHAPKALERDEWAFLATDDGRYLMMARPHRPGPFGAWVWEGPEAPSPDDGDGAPPWPAVAVSWTETAVVEEARRDIPLAWDVVSSDGTLRGTLFSVSRDHRTLAGSGPISPVLALHEVAGDLSVHGVPWRVRGFLRHAQR